jgi:hypothetical protein
MVVVQTVLSIAIWQWAAKYYVLARRKCPAASSITAATDKKFLVLPSFLFWHADF